MLALLGSVWQKGFNEERAMTPILEVPMAASATALALAASFMAIPADSLAVLPVVVEVFAKKAGVTDDYIVHQIVTNPGLREYAEQMCIKGMEAL